MFQFILEILKDIGISGILLFFIKRHYDRKDKIMEQREEEALKKENQIKSLNEHLEKHLEEFTKLNEKVGMIYDNQIELQEDNKITMRSSADLLRDKMLQVYKRCYEQQEYISLHEKENFLHMYEDYKRLGGNGMIDDIHEKIMDLPTKKDK